MDPTSPSSSRIWYPPEVVHIRGRVLKGPVPVYQMEYSDSTGCGNGSEGHLGQDPKNVEEYAESIHPAEREALPSENDPCKVSVCTDKLTSSTASSGVTFCGSKKFVTVKVDTSNTRVVLAEDVVMVKVDTSNMVPNIEIKKADVQNTAARGNSPAVYKCGSGKTFVKSRFLSKDKSLTVIELSDSHITSESVLSQIPRSFSPLLYSSTKDPLPLNSDITGGSSCDKDKVTYDENSLDCEICSSGPNCAICPVPNANGENQRVCNVGTVGSSKQVHPESSVINIKIRSMSHGNEVLRVPESECSESASEKPQNSNILSANSEKAVSSKPTYPSRVIVINRPPFQSTSTPFLESNEMNRNALKVKSHCPGKIVSNKQSDTYERNKNADTNIEIPMKFAVDVLGQNMSSKKNIEDFHIVRTEPSDRFNTLSSADSSITASQRMASVHPPVNRQTEIPCQACQAVSDSCIQVKMSKAKRSPSVDKASTTSLQASKKWDITAIPSMEERMRKKMAKERRQKNIEDSHIVPTKPSDRSNTLSSGVSSVVASQGMASVQPQVNRQTEIPCQAVSDSCIQVKMSKAKSSPSVDKASTTSLQTSKNKDSTAIPSMEEGMRKKMAKERRRKNFEDSYIVRTKPSDRSNTLSSGVSSVAASQGMAPVQPPDNRQTEITSRSVSDIQVGTSRAKSSISVDKTSTTSLQTSKNEDITAIPSVEKKMRKKTAKDRKRKNISTHFSNKEGARIYARMRNAKGKKFKSFKVHLSSEYPCSSSTDTADSEDGNTDDGLDTNSDIKNINNNLFEYTLCIRMKRKPKAISERPEESCLDLFDKSYDSVRKVFKDMLCNRKRTKHKQGNASHSKVLKPSKTQANKTHVSVAKGEAHLSTKSVGRPDEASHKASGSENVSEDCVPTEPNITFTRDENNEDVSCAPCEPERCDLDQSKTVEASSKEPNITFTRDENNKDVSCVPCEPERFDLDKSNTVDTSSSPTKSSGHFKEDTGCLNVPSGMVRSDESTPIVSDKQVGNALSSLIHESQTLKNNKVSLENQNLDRIEKRDVCHVFSNVTKGNTDTNVSEVEINSEADCTKTPESILKDRIEKGVVSHVSSSTTKGNTVTYVNEVEMNSEADCTKTPESTEKDKIGKGDVSHVSSSISKSNTDTYVREVEMNSVADCTKTPESIGVLELPSIRACKLTHRKSDFKSSKRPNFPSEMKYPQNCNALFDAVGLYRSLDHAVSNMSLQNREEFSRRFVASAKGEDDLQPKRKYPSGFVSYHAIKYRKIDPSLPSFEHQDGHDEEKHGELHLESSHLYKMKNVEVRLSDIVNRYPALSNPNATINLRSESNPNTTINLRSKSIPNTTINLRSKRSSVDSLDFLGFTDSHSVRENDLLKGQFVRLDGNSCHLISANEKWTEGVHKLHNSQQSSSTPNSCLDQRRTKEVGPVEVYYQSRDLTLNLDTEALLTMENQSIANCKDDTSRYAPETKSSVGDNMKGVGSVPDKVKKLNSVNYSEQESAESEGNSIKCKERESEKIRAPMDSTKDSVKNCSEVASSERDTCLSNYNTVDKATQEVKSASGAESENGLEQSVTGLMNSRCLLNCNVVDTVTEVVKSASTANNKEGPEQSETQPVNSSEIDTCLLNSIIVDKVTKEVNSTSTAESEESQEQSETQALDSTERDTCLSKSNIVDKVTKEVNLTSIAESEERPEQSQTQALNSSERDTCLSNQDFVDKVTEVKSTTTSDSKEGTEQSETETLNSNERDTCVSNCNIVDKVTKEVNSTSTAESEERSEKSQTQSLNSSERHTCVSNCNIVDKVTKVKSTSTTDSKEGPEQSKTLPLNCNEKDSCVSNCNVVDKVTKEVNLTGTADSEERPEQSETLPLNSSERNISFSNQDIVNKVREEVTSASTANSEERPEQSETRPLNSSETDTCLSSCNDVDKVTGEGKVMSTGTAFSEEVPEQSEIPPLKSVVDESCHVGVKKHDGMDLFEAESKRSCGNSNDISSSIVDSESNKRVTLSQGGRKVRNCKDVVQNPLNAVEVVDPHHKVADVSCGLRIADGASGDSSHYERKADDVIDQISNHSRPVGCDLQTSNSIQNSYGKFAVNVPDGDLSPRAPSKQSDAKSQNSSDDNVNVDASSVKFVCKHKARLPEIDFVPQKIIGAKKPMPEPTFEGFSVIPSLSEDKNGSRPVEDSKTLSNSVANIVESINLVPVTDASSEQNTCTTESPKYPASAVSVDDSSNDSLSDTFMNHEESEISPVNKEHSPAYFIADEPRANVSAVPDKNKVCDLPDVPGNSVILKASGSLQPQEGGSQSIIEKLDHSESSVLPSINIRKIELGTSMSCYVCRHCYRFFHFKSKLMWHKKKFCKGGSYSCDNGCHIESKAQNGNTKDKSYANDCSGRALDQGVPRSTSRDLNSKSSLTHLLKQVRILYKASEVSLSSDKSCRSIELVSETQNSVELDPSPLRDSDKEVSLLRQFRSQESDGAGEGIQQIHQSVSENRAAGECKTLELRKFGKEFSLSRLHKSQESDVNSETQQRKESGSETETVNECKTSELRQFGKEIMRSKQLKKQKNYVNTSTRHNVSNKAAKSSGDIGILITDVQSLPTSDQPTELSSRECARNIPVISEAENFAGLNDNLRSQLSDQQLKASSNTHGYTRQTVTCHSSEQVQETVIDEENEIFVKDEPLDSGYPQSITVLPIPLDEIKFLYEEGCPPLAQSISKHLFQSSISLQDEESIRKILGNRVLTVSIDRVRAGHFSREKSQTSHVPVEQSDDHGKINEANSRNVFSTSDITEACVALKDNDVESQNVQLTSNVAGTSTDLLDGEELSESKKRSGGNELSESRKESKKKLKEYPFIWVNGCKVFPCEVCGHKFKIACELRRHMPKHTGERPYKCKLCPKAYTRYTGLMCHVDSHFGIKYPCNVCGKKLSQKSHLLTHLKKHKGEKNHKCEKCGKAFIRKSHLRLHSHVHSEIRAHKCPHCPKAFKNKYNLRIHIRYHTNDKRHKCQECSAAFVLSSDLKKHMSVHTKDFVRNCEVCGKRFTSDSGYRKHKKIFHP